MLNWLTPRDVADLLGVSLDTLRNMRVKGTGPPYIKIGGRIKYEKEDLMAWIRNKTKR